MNVATGGNRRDPKALLRCWIGMRIVPRIARRPAGREGFADWGSVDPQAATGMGQVEPLPAGE